MKIQKINIENYKNIEVLEIQLDGKNLTLRAKNGGGKSAVIEAVFKLLRGKGFVIPDAVMHGKESATITVDIGNNKVDFSLRAVIKKDGDYSLKFAQVLPNGKIGKYTDGMTAFIKSLFYEYSIDPVKFNDLDGEEQVKMLYNLMPEIQGPIQQCELDKKTIQAERSDNLKEQKKVEGELLVTKFTPDLPEVEIDPAELMEELNVARTHNASIDGVKTNLRLAEQKYSSIHNNIKANTAHLNNLKIDLERIQAAIKKAEENEVELNRTAILVQGDIDTFTKTISEFQEIPTAPIQEKINNLKSTNEKIRANQRYNELNSKLAELKLKYREGLKRMDAKEQEKLDIIKAAKMPIPGLTIGENCLMVPDPITGNLVNIKNLSTGQSIPVCVQILAAFLPKPEEGIRAMAVNLNEVDDDNFKILMQAGKDNGIQFVMHETLKHSDNSEIEVLITE